MTQTIPATAILGPGMTGLTIGYRILDIDRVVYSAFTTTNVAETSTAGTYSAAGGVVAPLAGGYIVWGTALVDYAEATVESAAVNVTMHAGVAVAAADVNGNVPVNVKAWDDEGVSPNLPTVRAQMYNGGDYIDISYQVIRDAMKLAPTAGAPAAGSVDKHLDDILEDTGTTLPASLATIDDFLDTEVAAILADTNELQTDLVNGGRLDLLLDAIKGKTDGLPTDPADQSAMEAAITAATSTLATAANLATLAGYVDTEVAAILAAVDTEVAAIKAKTDNLPASPAAVGSAMTLTAAYDAAKTAATQASVDAVPTVAEFEARTLPSADYTVVSDLPSVAGLALEATAQSILTDTGTTLDTLIKDIPTNAELTAALAGADDATLAAIAALNNLSSAQAQTAATAALNAYDPPTNAEMEARTLVAANYATAAALTAVDDFVDTEVAAIKAVTDKLDTALVLDGAVYQFTANALELAPTGGSAPSAADIRAEIDANSTQLAAILEDTGTTLPASLATVAGYLDTEVAAILAAVDTEVAAIKAKTDNLPASPAAVGSEMVLTVAYDAAKTAATQTSVNDLPTNAELATALAGADDTVLAAVAALNNLSSAQAQTAAAAALTAYDPPTNAEMEARTLAAASYATATALDAVDNYVDTEVAAIKAVTDKLDTALELDGAVYRYTINALEQAPAGGGGGSYAGDGTGYYTDTIDDGTSPLDGVRVQLYTAQNRVGPAYEAYTNALGVFEMWPDPGTYYRWLDYAGVSFAQDVAVVVTEP